MFLNVSKLQKRLNKTYLVNGLTEHKHSIYKSSFTKITSLMLSYFSFNLFVGAMAAPNPNVRDDLLQKYPPKR